MRRRPGITLIEVLVAIFIMSIGLLALLTLFPLGALRMSQALQYDRAASCANAGANICDAFDLRNDPFPLQPPQLPVQPGAFYPAYVDPYGVAISSGPLGGSIRRVAPSFIPAPNNTPSTAAARYFTLLDDMTFYTNGQADSGANPGTASLQRGDRYTWGLMLRQLSPSSVPSLTVVVYAGRATALPGGEATYAVQAGTGTYQDTSVTLNYTGSAPTIRRGTWILDTSSDPATGLVHGDFYRVVSVTTVSATQVNLELQTPISRAITAVTVMDNVVDVFDRGTAPSSQWEFHTQP
jgi:prepilin-type N-terminal cleavage/methylation domain-containing protein